MSRTTLAILAALLTGCASYRGIDTMGILRYPGQMIVQARGMVYVRLDTPCADGRRPGQMIALVRERDVGSVAVVCTADCKCKVVKVRRRVPAESGICR